METMPYKPNIFNQSEMPEIKYFSADLSVEPDVNLGDASFFFTQSAHKWMRQIPPLYSVPVEISLVLFYLMIFYKNYYIAAKGVFNEDGVCRFVHKITIVNGLLFAAIAPETMDRMSLEKDFAGFLVFNLIMVLFFMFSDSPWPLGICVSFLTYELQYVHYFVDWCFCVCVGMEIFDLEMKYQRPAIGYSSAGVLLNALMVMFIRESGVTFIVLGLFLILVVLSLGYLLTANHKLLKCHIVFIMLYPLALYFFTKFYLNDMELTSTHSLLKAIMFSLRK